MIIHEIEKDIEMPIRHRDLYPLSKMAVGNSFLVEKTHEEDLRRLQTRLQPVIYYYKKNYNKTFATRTMEKENGVRVWRVK